MVLAGSSFAVVSDNLWEAVVFPARGLSRVSLTSVAVRHFLDVQIISDDLLFSSFLFC